MNELFLKEGHSIHTFKPGDIIIRVKPVYRKVLGNPDPDFPFSTGYVTIPDQSFRSEPVELVAVENNIIYLRSIKPICNGEKHLWKALLDEYGEGWEMFIIPPTMSQQEVIALNLIW